MSARQCTVTVSCSSPSSSRFTTSNVSSFLAVVLLSFRKSQARASEVRPTQVYREPVDKRVRYTKQ
ncbi:hypothetical protein K503DRAFT_770639 [Rhizopogon vinicolor AM-OR11-026]|uniref:Uncharacterized protein n=1 Tax=Rhizopogon vinicolor AM-OR11-026 TaxID=1314800 RepID=A0A1B7N0C7_9AGAM|nr:hypothetical protein K503DRAFT_770639 [Rhizopogon vinicolor AM-OR11-026]